MALMGGTRRRAFGSRRPAQTRRSWLTHCIVLTATSEVKVPHTQLPAIGNTLKMGIGCTRAGVARTSGDVAVGGVLKVARGVGEAEGRDGAGAKRRMGREGTTSLWRKN